MGGNQIIANCKIGDVISIRSSASFTLANDIAQHISISKTGTLQPLMANDKVIAKYTLPVSSSITAGNIVNYSSKIYDTHNAVTVGASWKFTAPMSGYYLISSFQNGNSAHYLTLHVNGTASDIMSGGASNSALKGSTIVLLNSGDYIDVRTNGNSTTQSITYIDIQKRNSG